MVYNIGKALLERLHFGAYIVLVRTAETFPLLGIILHHNAPKIILREAIVIASIPNDHQA